MFKRLGCDLAIPDGQIISYSIPVSGNEQDDQTSKPIAVLLVRKYMTLLGNSLLIENNPTKTSLFVSDKFTAVEGVII